MNELKREITMDNLRFFDDWLLNNDKITQDDREVAVELVFEFLKLTDFEKKMEQYVKFGDLIR